MFNHQPFILNEFSMLDISLENFLSIFIRLSTWLQLYITVEWSRPPTSLPMRLAGIFVYFWARYIDTWRAMTKSFLRLLLLMFAGVTL